MKKHYLIFFYLLFFLSMQGQQFRNINVSHGMLNNQAWRVQALDNRSLLVGFDNAFSIYDGARFRECPYDYRHSYPLKAYAIGRTYMDNHHRLWIKNYVNMFLFDQRQGQFVYHIKELFDAVDINEHVNDLFMDADSDAWVMTLSGKLMFARLPESDKDIHAVQAVTAYTLNRHERDAGIKIIEVAQAGNQCLLFFSDGTIRVYDKSRRRMTVTKFRLENINEPYTEIVWCKLDPWRTAIATHYENGGIAVYDSRKHTLTTILTGGKAFVKMLKDNHGRLMAFHIDGYEMFDKSLRHIASCTSFPTEDYVFTSHDILDATIDWQGGLWMASYAYGLFYTNSRLDHKSLLTLPDGDKLPVIAVAPCGEGVICCTRKNLYYMDYVKNEIRRICNVGGNDIRTLNPGSNGKIFVGMQDGIMVLKDGKLTAQMNARNISGLNHNSMPFALDIDGRLLVGSGPSGMGWIDGTAKKYIPIRKNDNDKYRDLHYIYYDQQNYRVVVGAKFGMFQYDLNTRRFSDMFGGKAPFEGRSLNCNSFLCDIWNNEWYATNSGLFVQPPHQKMQRLIVSDGLMGNCVNALVQDDKGIIWALTPSGLVSITLKNGKTDANTMRLDRYDIGSLIGGGEFIINSLAVSHGIVYCGSSKGVVCLRPSDKSLRHSCPLKPMLALVSIFGNPVSRDGVFDGRNAIDWQQSLITLRHDENTVTLLYTACNYLRSGQTRYRYRIGEDDPWTVVVAGDLNINLSHLSPGSYHLQVETQSNDGSWNYADPWTLRILPPWWMTWWMMGVYLIVMAVIVYVARYVYRERHRLLEQLNDRRNKLIMQMEKVKPEDLEITPRDEEFLNKAVADVEAHISDSNYSVESLAQKMAVSRSLLYRKLQAISGQTPTEFIRTIRLKRAEQLLRESGMNVDEVATCVGFNATRYFSKYFKEMYDMSPNEYKKQKK